MKSDHEVAVNFPKLFWAGTILFVMNIAVAIGVMFSPDLPVTRYSDKRGTAAAVDRPSPFQVVSTKPARIRPAVHIIPVLHASIELPRHSESSLLRPVVYRSLEVAASR